jgi:hypothetical protein
VPRRSLVWLDFGDDCWHQIDVAAIEDKVPSSESPKVTKRAGKSPPRYAHELFSHDPAVVPRPDEASRGTMPSIYRTGMPTMKPSESHEPGVRRTGSR